MSQNLIPSDSARWFAGQILERGVPPKKLFQNTGLDEEWLAREESMITFELYARLVENALEETADPALGLNIGRKVNLGAFGFWGYAIMSSKDINEANRVSLTYWELNGSLVNTLFKIEKGFGVWEIYPAFPFEDETLLIFAMEEWITACFYAISNLVTQSPELSDVNLTYSAPPHAALYQEIFRCPVHFDQKLNRIRMREHLLDIPIVQGNPKIEKLCAGLCEEMLIKLKGSDKLIETIRNLIIFSPGKFPNLRETAEALQLSPRTLKRRLRERGTTFQKTLDEVRTELAKRYLGETRLNIDQISDLIGFAESSAFRAAFKRWTGKNPSEFRKPTPTPPRLIPHDRKIHFTLEEVK